MQEVKRFKILSVAKIAGLIGVLVGLLAGILFAVVPAEQTLPGVAGMISGWRAIVFWPVVYGGYMFVVGLIGTALYNLLAKKFGGIQIEFSKEKK